MLIEQGALFLIPRFDPSRVEGVAGEILIRYSKNGFGCLADLISREAQDCLVYLEPHRESSTVTGIVARNVTRASELLQLLKDQEEVIWAKLYLIQGILRVREQRPLPISVRNVRKRRTKLGINALNNLPRS